jgi:serine/threonine protein kinase
MKELPELFPAGHRLGRYELIRRLAVGGMAEIYLARARGIQGFEKLVVLKRILPQHALDPQLLRMFLDEARLMATLTHPHITQVYDVGDDDDAPFFAMEYVHGANLREMMHAAAAAGGGSRDGRPARLPLPHAVGILAAAAAGLHYAHDKLGPTGEPLNIVHRDVSPSNVLVTYDGAVKVSDFGIAKWSSQRSQTQEGALKGKFAYMSPEQCRGEPLDRRSDVFALGTLLYELTTGAPPFQGSSDYDVLNQIVSRSALPPTVADPTYPAELERIVLRALARSPDDRYPTAQALQLDVEAFAREAKLVVSPVALGTYMQELFADRLEAWHRAQRSGKSLEQHLAEAIAGGEAGALRAARQTPTTATDAFAVPPGEPAPPRAPAPPSRRRRPITPIAVGALAAVLAAGVAAALRARDDQPGTLGGFPGRPATDSARPAELRPRLAAPAIAAGAPARAAEPPPAAAPTPAPAARPTVEPAAARTPVSTAAEATNIVEGHSVSPAPANLGRAKRAGRKRTTPGDLPDGASAPTVSAAPALKTWDPDSPIPP